MTDGDRQLAVMLLCRGMSLQLQWTVWFRIVGTNEGVKVAPTVMEGSRGLGDLGRGLVDILAREARFAGMARCREVGEMP